MAEKRSFREKKQDVFDEICDLHNSVNSNPPLWLPLELKAAGNCEPYFYFALKILNKKLISDGRKHIFTSCQMYNSRAE